MLAPSTPREEEGEGGSGGGVAREIVEELVVEGTAPAAFVVIEWLDHLEKALALSTIYVVRCCPHFHLALWGMLYGTVMSSANFFHDVIFLLERSI